LTANDNVSLHQMYEGVFIAGSIGGGKTTGPGEEVARFLLEKGAGFCVLTAKPDEYSRWVRLCEQTGRSADLVRFSPDSGVRCDLLNTELSHPEGTVAAASAMLAMLVEVESRQAEGHGDEQFWRLACEKHFRRAIHAIWKGKGRCSLTDVYRFIVSAPADPAQVKSAEWRGSSYCAECLRSLGERCSSDYDAIMTGEYWLVEWPQLAEKPRSIIYTMTSNLLDKFLFAEVARMVSSGETNFSPDDIAAGKVCVLDMPYLKWREPGRFFQILFKTLVQRSALRRDVNELPKPIVVWQDEGQVFLTPEDVQVQAVARQSRLVSVFITQSLPVLYEALGGGPRAEQQGKALIGNLQTKFVCQQSDNDSCQFFSKMFGESKQLLGNSNMNSGPVDPVADWLGMERPQTSAGMNQQWLPTVRPEEFTRLKKGGHENAFFVECYVYQGGRKFSNGKTWIRCSIRQKV
jgi:hypothetical protein